MRLVRSAFATLIAACSAQAGYCATPVAPVAPAAPAAPVAPATPYSMVAAPAPAPVQYAPAAAAAPAPAQYAPAGFPAPVPAGVAALGLGSAGPGCASCDPCGCMPGCGPKCIPCGPPGQFWVGVQYLGWATKGDHLPPLVTASPPGTARGLTGVLGQPTTQVVTGDSNYNGAMRSGVRVYGGLWLDECNRFGIGGDYFYLGRSNNSRTFGAGAGANDVQYNRPFFNAATGLPDAELVSFPGVLAGTVTVNTSSSVQGFNPNFIANLCCCCDYRVDFLVGYRYLNLRDRVDITERLTSVDPTLAGTPVGTQLIVRDSFHTRNTFNGGNIGLYGEKRFGRAYVAGTAAIAFGVTHKVIDVNGSTTTITPGGVPVTQTGGLLAQRTNIGRFTQDDFSVVPAVGARLGYQVTDNLRAFVGYDFIYWSNVTRPGDVIDSAVNPTQLPPGTLQGAARPARLAGSADYWLQGISGGLEFRY